ncbi:adenylosuccinate lyase [Alkalispirochaeta americana]|uniref:Adenylosuccinate lyase n=1 Tax=Alkalispirochaeta americana TaxID=159291 RepID=A0A1N6N8K5_9SPIO|nr:lyase family protein [Alkalispirochaeta americana]SIP88381.1 adenylosuccinate lyase [Alkalispirochaeta americana]
MQSENRFRNLSPLDHRYYLANQALFDRLADILSEEASVAQCVQVEAVLLRHLVSHVLREDARKEEYLEKIRDLPRRVSAGEVYREEETTRHNVRAIVNVIQRHLPQEIQHLVHLGATSVDILDTAAAIRYREATQQVVVPLLLDLQELLIKLAEDEAETVSIGRTHGQYAVPITLGFAMAEYVSRLGDSIARIAEAAGDLRGKLAGAVGAYNATSVLHPDPEELERQVLADLGLAPGEHATQIVSPEPLLRLLLEMNTAFGVVANLADDLRHLQRSEIGEFSEYFAQGQVGSSTMPHKRNPWNAEHVKSLWKAFSPRAMTWFMDQISEHQRDLSNSASGRFVVEYVAGFVAALERMRSIIERLRVDRGGIERNLREGARRVIAEPLYILLAAGGVADAHEQVRRLTLAADEGQGELLELVRADEAVWSTVSATYRRLTGGDPEEFFADPSRYTGRAAARTRRICANHRERVAQLRKDSPS